MTVALPSQPQYYSPPSLPPSTPAHTRTHMYLHGSLHPPRCGAALLTGSLQPVRLGRTESWGSTGGTGFAERVLCHV